MVTESDVRLLELSRELARERRDVLRTAHRLLASMNVMIPFIARARRAAARHRNNLDAARGARLARKHAARIAGLLEVMRATRDWVVGAADLAADLWLERYHVEDTRLVVAPDTLREWSGTRSSPEEIEAARLERKRRRAMRRDEVKHGP